MLTSIKIEKLFDMFDYDIELKEDGVTILTGPNGYGKTTILKILVALANDISQYFHQLPFRKIVLEFSEIETITIEKDEGIKAYRWKQGDKVYPVRYTPVDGESLDFSTNFQEQRTNKIQGTGLLSSLPGLSRALPEIPNVYFIQEQRLLRPVKLASKKSNPYLNFEEESHQTFSKVIEEYAQELREIIKDTLAKSSQLSQELDSSFPHRLFNQQEGISDTEFNQRYDQIKLIQQSLAEYGLSDIKIDSDPTYKQENAKALNVYIEDTEKKLAIFNGLLKKLTLFTEILNERRFTFKKIIISREDGFKFVTQQNTPLALGDLSSGEQHETVLLYELMFKVKPGTLVLIDEPELSLHVVWQKQFLDDLFKIIELQKISVIVATHSPQIINNHWDLTVDLEDLRNVAASTSR